MLMVDMLVFLATNDIRVGIAGITDEFLDAPETIGSDHGPAVNSVQVSGLGRGHHGPDTHFRDALAEDSEQVIVLVDMDDEALNPDAVLAHVLAEEQFSRSEKKKKRARRQCSLDSTHPQGCPFVEVGTGENDSWVLSSKFERYGGQVFGSSDGDLEIHASERLHPEIHV